MNTGEYNEILVKLLLIQYRDSKKIIPTISNNFIITSVGFGGIEYESLPKGTILKNLTNSELIKLAYTVGIRKAGALDKADVYINNMPYSIKSLQKAPPALVNHTARPGWERVCNELGISISELDDMIDKYWDLRKRNIIKEDVSNNDINSPFANHKEYLSKILNYFLFKGSGSKESKHPASFILDFVDPLNINTWKVWGSDYIDKHWHRLVFSLRSRRGMGNYPYITNKNKKDSMAKWTVLWQNGYKGALHVRVK